MTGHNRDAFERNVPGFKPLLMKEYLVLNAGHWQKSATALSHGGNRSVSSAESGVSLDIQSNIQKELFAWTNVGLDIHRAKLETEASSY